MGGRFVAALGIATGVTLRARCDANERARAVLHTGTVVSRTLIVGVERDCRSLYQFVTQSRYLRSRVVGFAKAE